MNWILPENQKSTLIEQLKHIRNIKDEETFFNPQKEHLHAPNRLFGAKKAATELQKAIKNNKKIVIHGDFDVDGITATSLMWRFLYYDLGADVIPYIPSRFDEGYGLTDESIEACLALDADIIITVDCGIKDIDLVAKYKDSVDFIITDHHTVISKDKSEEFNKKDTLQVGDNLIAKHALAVVHPALETERIPYPIRDICGATVSWKVCMALGELTENTENAYKYIDLAALGTVCDIMPLVGENRTIVALGLEQMKSSEIQGIQALAEASKLDISNVKAENLGFILGPRLNAAGRLEHALDAVRLLSTQNTTNANSYASALNTLNTKRRDLTKQYYEEALQILKSNKNRLHNVVIGENWPEGILGLIAGKLLTNTGLPSLVATTLPDGTIKGSGRSISTFNITNALDASSKYLERFGGHAEAAGFSLLANNKEGFIESLQTYVQKNLSKDDLQLSIPIDYVLSGRDITIETVESIDRFEPFGEGNRSPIIGILDFNVVSTKLVGKSSNHLKIVGEKEGMNFEAMWFNVPMEQYEEIKNSQNYSIVGKMSINNWMDRQSVSIFISDGRK